MRITDFLTDDHQLEETVFSTCDFFKEEKALQLNGDFSHGLEIPMDTENVNFMSLDNSEMFGCDYLHDVLNGVDSSTLDIESNFLSDGSLDASSPANLSHKSDLLTFFSSNESCSSGSDVSPLEVWNIKSEPESPPVSPANVNISPSTSPTPYYVIPGNCLAFVQHLPVEGSRVHKPRKTNSQTSCLYGNKVKIKPRPDDTNGHMPEASDLVSEPTIQNSKKSDLTKDELMKLRAQRKHERMIRNRESACLSRKKRKEYVTQLEDRIKELSLENASLKMENKQLKDRLRFYGDKSSLYLTKQTNKSFSISATKKTTALLALVVMVCLNVGSLSLLNERSDNMVDSDKVLTIPAHAVQHGGGRSLLWNFDTDDNKNNITTNVNNTAGATCPMFINQSESIRLESELRRWIGSEENFTHTNVNKFDSIKILDLFQTDSNSNTNNQPKKLRKQMKKHHMKSTFASEMDIYNNLFNLNNFFETINRRDDTFYVVSFSGDHLLLPALAHNKTHRPKMSLMLPAFHFNSTTGNWSDEVKMMQIDCEVTNTNLFNVNEQPAAGRQEDDGNLTKSGGETDGEEMPSHLKKLWKNKKNNDTYKSDNYPNISLAQVLLDRSTNNNTKHQPKYKNLLFSKYENISKFN